MELTFLGTGEAFDTERGNYSSLIETEVDGKSRSIMVDCGYKASYWLRRHLKKQSRSILDVPNTLLFTHFHGDHFGGTPALIVPMGDEISQYNNQNPDQKRIRELTVASAHKNVERRFKEKLQDDYPRLLEHFSGEGLRVGFEVLNGSQELEGLVVDSARTAHSVVNYAYRFTDKNGKSLAISGDGALTDESRELYRCVDLLVHEGFFLTQSSPTHASIKEVLDFAIESKLPRIAIVHVNQAQRAEGHKTGQIESMISNAKRKGVEVIFPNDLESVTI